MNIYPYVYKCTHKSTSEFYFGFRKANKVSAELDLGIIYKTSSKIVKPNFSEYSYEVIAEFYDAKDAYEFEQQLIKEYWDDELLLNKSFGGNPPTNKNLVVVKDASDKIFRVTINDPRYISGELVFYQVGTKLSEIHRKNISDSQKNFVTVKNVETNKGTRIHKDDLLQNNTKYVGINEGSKRSSKTKKLQSNSAKIACKTRYVSYVSRLSDRKVMSLIAFNRWLNNKPMKKTEKSLCCRISDRKVINVNHLNRTKESYLQTNYHQKKNLKI